jgi:AcrR family transcriptional regulator
MSLDNNHRSCEELFTRKDTNTKKTVREPQQKRSIDKKDKIIEAGYALICERGYYKTTTPEVAKEAGVSIGCFYSYFKDKTDLFMAVLDRYMSVFDAKREKAIHALSGPDLPMRDAFRALVISLIEIHEASKPLNDELKILYRSEPAIAARIDAHDEEIHAAILRSFETNKGRLATSDPEAAAFIVDDLVDVVVDRIVFGKQKIDRERILDACIDALGAYLGI